MNMNDILTNALGGIISSIILWIIGFTVTYCKNKHWTKENTLKAITEDEQVRDQIIEMTRSFVNRRIFIIGDNPQGRMAEKIINDMPQLINPSVDTMVHVSELEKIHRYDLIIVTESFLRGKDNRFDLLNKILDRKSDAQALIAYAPDFTTAPHPQNGFVENERIKLNNTMNATMTNAQGRLQSDIYALLQTIPS